VVLVENVVRRLSDPGERDKTVREVTAEAAHEVARPITFGIGIIILVYLPILTWVDRREDVQADGVDGRVRPRRSLLLTLTLVPVLASLFLRKTGREHEPRFVSSLRTSYLRALEQCFRRRALVVVVAAVVAVAGGAVGLTLGGEFIPRLDEGDLSISAVRPASVGISRSRRAPAASSACCVASRRWSPSSAARAARSWRRT